MRTLLTAALALSALAVATPAEARGPGHDRSMGQQTSPGRTPTHGPTAQRPATPPPPAARNTTIELHNTSGETAKVFVAGTFRGELAPGERRVYGTSPGTVRVEVVTRRGLELLDQRVTPTPHRLTSLRILRPMATFVVDNEGPTPLLVTVPGTAPFWLVPGQERTLTSRADALNITTQIAGFRGMMDAGSYRVDLKPGRIVEADLGWAPARRDSTLAVTNTRHRAVQVYLGGQAIGLVQPGSSRTLSVDPGHRDLLLVELGGNVLLDRRLDFDRGDTQAVVLDHRRTTVTELDRHGRGQHGAMPYGAVATTW